MIGTINICAITPPTSCFFFGAYFKYKTQYVHQEMNLKSNIFHPSLRRNSTLQGRARYPSVPTLYTSSRTHLHIVYLTVQHFTYERDFIRTRCQDTLIQQGCRLHNTESSSILTVAKPVHQNLPICCPQIGSMHLQ